MTPYCLDLTIQNVLADPVIGAAMRADRVDPARFEALLRATARQIDQRRAPSVLPDPAPNAYEHADRLAPQARGELPACCAYAAGRNYTATGARPSW